MSEGFCVFRNIFHSDQMSNFRIPTEIITNSGAVWVFCNDRRQSLADATQIQWISAVCAEDGINFGQPIYLKKKTGWQYIIGAAVYDKINNNMMLFYKSRIISEEARRVYDSLPDDKKEPLGLSILESRDGGISWTSRSVKYPENDEYKGIMPSTHGSSAGAQFTEGKYRGRLVVPLRYSSGETMNGILMKKASRACVMYSDDFGMTWLGGELMQYGSNEAALCLLPDGRVYLNTRGCYGNNRRIVAYSSDGGESIDGSHVDPTLVQTAYTGVKGSVTAFPCEYSKSGYYTLCTSLQSPTGFRDNLCLWISEDGGITWDDIVTIERGKSSYSEVIYDDKRGLITVIYEYGAKNCYSDGIGAKTFDLKWLLDNKKKFVPLRENRFPENAEPKITENGVLLSDSLASGLISQSVTEINGKRCLKFYGDECRHIDFGDFTTGNGISLVAVFKVDCKTGCAQTLINTEPQIFSFYIDETLDMYFTLPYGVPSQRIHAESTLDFGYHTVAITWTGGKNGCLTQFFDGKKEDVRYAFTDIPDISEKMKITLGDSFCGELPELIVYEKVLDDVEVAETMKALSEKYY